MLLKINYVFITPLFNAAKFCGEVETQQHINVACQHPPLVETRMLHRRRIEEFYMNYRHQHILPQQRWVIPLLDYMEDRLWSNTAEGGDVWNGRWTRTSFPRCLEGTAIYSPLSRTSKGP